VFFGKNAFMQVIS